MVGHVVNELKSWSLDVWEELQFRNCPQMFVLRLRELLQLDSRLC